MSDDDADPELLELLRQSLGISRPVGDEVSSDTGVLRDAEYIYNNAIDVAIDMHGTKAAAASIYNAMWEQQYSNAAWGEQELHPKQRQEFTDVDIVNFVFTMDLLNFSFWSELPESDRFQVEYRGRRWTGYQSLLACLRRALDEGIPITTPRYWKSPRATDEVLWDVFRSATDDSMPLLDERVAILREAAEILYESFGGPEAVTDGEEDADPGAMVTNEDLEDLKTVPAPPSQEAEVVTDDVETTAPDASLTHGHAVDGDTPELEPQSRREDRATSQSDPSQDLVQDETAEQKLAEDPATMQPDSTTVSIPLVAEARAPPYDTSVVRLIERADHSAGKLVNLLAKHFPCFRDETRFDGRRVRILKRAQIFVADLWAAFEEKGYGEFGDIDHLTMFADYRVPQMLHSLGVLSYSPPLSYRITDLKLIPSGHSWEVQLRGCSIWAVELIRREIGRVHPEAGERVNAVLIDFFLYDLAKARESGLGLPHHRTRCIWYWGGDLGVGHAMPEHATAVCWTLRGSKPKRSICDTSSKAKSSMTSLARDLVQSALVIYSVERLPGYNDLDKRDWRQ